METENLDDISLISATTKTSSWPIIRGTLDDAITSESSISAVDSDLAVHETPKPPLILRRPSPDSGPCEITISFTQQHEIKQVYVRSTARVYEIYCAADKKGGSEYLCTVRCGVAAKTDELLQKFDGVGSLSTSSSSSNRTVCEGHLRSDSGGSTNEDDWVDVKVQNPSLLEAKDSCLSKKDESCMEPGNQDYFEATAEISDADPVLSITLRLLSIQSGDYIYIDEVYVFADPLVSTDTNFSTNTPGASSESATMSLLIPTLLNLSNFRRKQIQEQNHSAVGERKHQDTGLKSISATMASSTSQSQSIQGTMHSGASGHMSQPEFPLQRLDLQNHPYSTSERSNFSCSHIERTLDELVSRVAKIEDFCLRFEEKLVKPISNMEARLERVEQQLESFTKATVSLTACTRISAPEYSCIGSESNSIFNGGNDSLGTKNSESFKQDESCPPDLPVLPSDEYSSLSNQPNNVSSLTTNAAQLIPSLVVTAPDFSYDDDEGENDLFEAVKDSPKASPKKPLSINDALASALAGFLSSVCDDTDMVDETANISNKEVNGSPCPSELILSDERVVSSVNIDGNNISGKDFAVTKLESFGADIGFKETAESVDEHNRIFEEGDSEKPLGASVCNVVNLDQVKTDIYDFGLNRSGEADDDSNQTLVFGSLESPVNDTSVTALVPAANIDSCSGEMKAKECPDILLNILELPSPTMVDFEIPILDVKFVSQENFSAKSSLDALLVDVPDVRSEVPCVDEDNATSFNEQYDLVMIENADSKICETPNSQLFCLDNYDSGCMPSNTEEEEQQDCSIQDMGASLI